MVDFFRSKFIEDSDKISFEDKKGLELGSGTGLLGIYLIKNAKFGEFHLTDFDQKV